LTKSAPTVPVQERARLRASSSLRPSVVRQAFMTPEERSFLVRARVSTPSMPGMPYFFSQVPRSVVARQLETIGESSRTTKPATCGRADSKSASLTP
jgi:hypothetical protein